MPAQLDAARTSSPAATVVCIDGGPLSWRGQLAELWQGRELLGFLAWRDVKVRYQQTFLGVAWAVFQPVLTMVVFALILGRLAGMQAHVSVPYAVFALAGLVPWTFAANTLVGAANSLVGSQHLITKVYFPRLLVPLAVVGAGVVDLLVGLALLLVLMPVLGIWPSLSVLAAPLVLVLLVITVAALGCLLAGVTAVYRDVRFVVPFLVQVGMFITPVLWPAPLLAGPWKWLVLMNPVAGSLDAFRAAVLGSWTWETSLGLALSAATTIGLVVAAMSTFSRVEQELADVI